MQAEDLCGKKFGSLTVINRVQNGKNGHTRWLCKCDCGKEVIKFSENLKSAKNASCGCYKSPNLEGKIFGRLTVIAKDGKNKWGHYSWLCKCDCGKEIIVTTSHLFQGSVNSCGCLKRELLSLAYGEASLKRLYGIYKDGAIRKRKIEFDLSLEFFEKITKKDCFYCGASPYQVIKNSFNNGDYIYNGIDRIDSSLGYREDNVVPCCGICNYMKRTMNHKEFLDHVEKIYNHFKTDVESKTIG